MSRKVVTLDVREDIRQGREPFSRIMQAVSALKPNEDLLLVAPFEPAPLFSVLGQQGFSHTSTPTPAGEYEVLFTRSQAPTTRPSGAVAAAPKKAAKSCAGTPVIDVDARGLEPPQPLVKILEALATLPEGARLRAHTDRRPMHLYPHLEERGFKGDTAEQKDGTFVTYVQRV